MSDQTELISPAMPKKILECQVLKLSTLGPTAWSISRSLHKVSKLISRRGALWHQSHLILDTYVLYEVFNSHHLPTYKYKRRFHVSTSPRIIFQLRRPHHCFHIRNWILIRSRIIYYPLRSVLFILVLPLRADPWMGRCRTSHCRIPGRVVYQWAGQRAS